MLETVPVLGLNLMTNAQLIGQDNLVVLGHNVDADLSTGTGHFGADVVAVGLGAGAVEVGNLVVPELDDTNSVIDVIGFLELGVVSQGTNSPARLGDGVVEEPKGQINVVDGAVDKDAAVSGGIAYKETSLIKHIASVGAHYEGFTNGILLYLENGFAVGVVEATGESSHDFEVGFLSSSINYLLSLQNTLVC